MIEGYIVGFRGPVLVAGTEIVAVTTDLTSQKSRETNHLDRSQFVDDPRSLPAMVRHLICASGPRREHADGGT
jgi:hypothetical protein